MKVHSLTILHYGKDYLSYALRSIYHNVDKLHIFYTPTPSHGHSVNTPPIETKEELIKAAYAYDPDNKIVWYDIVGVTHEGMQRDIALKTIEAAGAELVVVVDYDEVWGYGTLDELLCQVYDHGKARNNLVNMTHLWRSFNWCCKDEGWPVRIIDLRQDNNDTFYIPKEYDVYHFGYAITNHVMQYKWKIHGHKNELRPDWFNDKWSRWPPPDNCHPTNGRNENGKPFWTPRLFDKLKLPVFMAEHPFFGLDKIE
jgi:hypothetical protein